MYITAAIPEVFMADNPPTYRGFAAILGGLVALALVVFLATGGDLGGTKKIEGDADLPQVVSPKTPPDADNVGTR
jgi:hypothetical protein